MEKCFRLPQVLLLRMEEVHLMGLSVVGRGKVGDVEVLERSASSPPVSSLPQMRTRMGL